MKKHQTKSKKGFTLVELIIVITILAILATIAFISFQNYTKDARDGNRVATLTNLQKGLDVYAIKTGKYPIPNGNILTGSFNDIPLALAGNIGDEISRIVNMSTTPNDPISKNNYVYGVTENQQYYQIATILENLQTSSIISTTYANGTQAYVVGNYKGLYKKGENTLYNLPSLIFTGSGNLISSGTYFVIDKGQNLPYKINNTSPSNTQTTTQVLKQLTGKDDLILTGVTVTEKNYQTFTGTLGYSEDIIGVVRFGEKEYNEKISKGLGTSTSDEINTVTPATCNTGEDGSSGVCKDSYTGSTIIMHFDGSDGSTIYTDETGNYTFTNYGNAKISNTYSKFGSSSLYTNGANGYISLTHDDLKLGDQPFTLEFFVYNISIPSSGYGYPLLSYGNGNEGAGGFALEFFNYANSTRNFWLRNSYSNIVGYGSGAITSSKWHHLAVVRDTIGGKVRLFVDGIPTNYLNSTENFGNVNYLKIGDYTGAWLNNGSIYIDELRITKGVARYTGNFAPPTQSFPNQ